MGGKIKKRENTSRVAQRQRRGMESLRAEDLKGGRREPAGITRGNGKKLGRIPRSFSQQ